MDEFGVPEYFAGESLFVTGATGFMGKVFIEKLLRSCPDVDKVYLLVRPKRALTLEQRLKIMYDLPLFDVLRDERPQQFNEKVIAIAGDVAELGLGMSAEDRKLIIENVGILVHCAATVRFDQPLKEAIMMNTRGTREMCQLALELKNPKMMLHLSTAYAHSDRDVIEERMYPPHADWRKAIETAEAMDCETLKMITPLYISGFPNTYTFTKSMAESVVYDMLNNKIPNIILRPSIVVHTQKDPFPGWVDNFNGPVGLFIASGTGVNRISLVPDIRADYVSVDGAIKAMLISMWYNGARHDQQNSLETTVYNASSHGIQDISMHQLISMAMDLSWEHPLNNTLWYPTPATTTSTTIYYIYVLLFHMVPGFLIDVLLRMLKQKPRVVKIQRLIYTATMALKFFIFNEWTIDNKNLLGLEDELLERDKEAFGYDAHDLDVRLFFKNALFGAKKYLLKENLEDVEYHKKKFRTFYYLDVVMKSLFYAAVFYYLFVRYNVLNYILGFVGYYFGTL